MVFSVVKLLFVSNGVLALLCGRYLLSAGRGGNFRCVLQLFLDLYFMGALFVLYAQTFSEESLLLLSLFFVPAAQFISMMAFYSYRSERKNLEIAQRLILLQSQYRILQDKYQRASGKRVMSLAV